MAIPAIVMSMAFPGSGGNTASADAMYVSLGPYFPCDPDSPGLGAPFGAPVPPPLMLDGAVDAGGCEVEDFFPPLFPLPMMDVRVITSVVLTLLTCAKEVVIVWPPVTTTPVCHEVEGATVVTVVTMTVCWTEVEACEPLEFDPEFELLLADCEFDWEEPLCVAELCCDPEFYRRSK